MSTLTSPIRIMAVAGLMMMGSARTGLAVDIVDDPVQIDERISQVVQTTNSLCWEMYRFHQQKPDYTQSYRTAKDLWRQAGALRDALQNETMETETLMQQVAQMNDLFVRLDQSISKWGDGDRSMIAKNGARAVRTVVDDGVYVDLPFIGVQVGGPRVEIVDDGPPVGQRRRLHPNSRGSKRSLERELASVKLAMSYLLEDAGFEAAPTATPTPTPPAPGDTGKPVPQPPEETTSSLGEPVKVLPRVGKK
ncbi:MAG: hypothetical protein HY290_20515 [Planctomycetia bacterium]|nr:hypothetical protein [Planctomycetia bacterium]